LGKRQAEKLQDEQSLDLIELGASTKHHDRVGRNCGQIMFGYLDDD
jgi:hypothetical protein